MIPGGPILVIDTATTHAVVALGSPDGGLIAERSWAAGYRHGEELLARTADLLAAHAVSPTGLGGIVVGTGPGAFTGLRVGIATAKGLAYALGLPIVGVATAQALRAAAAADEPAAGSGGPVRFVVVQPAGPSDLVVSGPDSAPAILPGGTQPELREGDVLVAVDLAGRVSDDAVERGEHARIGLGAALLQAGAERLRQGAPDDLARLVPEYVTLPRGVTAVAADTGVSVTDDGAAGPAGSGMARR